MERLEPSVNFSTNKWENLTRILHVLLEEDYSVLIYRDEFGNNILRAVHNTYDETKFELMGIDDDLFTWEEVREITREKTYTLEQAIKELEIQLEKKEGK
jgi:hypothetical protein